MNIQFERRWGRDEWMIWKKDAFILCVYFYPINHIWFGVFGWMSVRLHRWETFRDFFDA